MTSLRQLIRHPLKTLLGVVLIMIACTLLCVSLGQYFASGLTRRQVEAEYTTIAVPTSQFQVTERWDEKGNIERITMEELLEIRKFFSELPARFPRAVKSVEQHDFISAYSSDVELMNYTGIFPPYAGDSMTGINTMPYTCAMFVIEINKIADVHPYLTELLPLEYITLQGMNPDDYGVKADVTGTVLEVCALQSGYENPVGRTIRLEVRTESEEAFLGLGLEVGKRYLVYGTDYMDWNWIVKCNISRNQEFYNNISWENIVPLTEEEKQRFDNDKSLSGTENYAAKYIYEIDGEEFWLTMSQSELDRIDSCSMTVCTNPQVLQGHLSEKEIRLVFSDRESSVISIEEYSKRYQQAGIVKLDSDVAEFLEAPENQIWKAALRIAEINNHSFPVIATDNLQGIAQFGTQDALIVNGRRFSADEYEQGRPVCIISESLAVQNKLDVGDHISLQYYEDDLNMRTPIYLHTANPVPHFYSPYEGFSSEEITYEIVGLYRQKQEWTTDEYSFTPNTIFVPKKSVCGQTETLSGGVFRSYILENGMTEWLEEELTALGYDGLLAYYDQGYSEIADSLSKYFVVAGRILLAGIAGWCILIAVFLFLFPVHQRQAAERMWTLGAPRSWVVKHILV
ncbi:MAG: hypothetical protein K2O34_14945, partial [Acetatifactor sp.]|nr:hypothetical protein [Acetatifactor sp.]